MKFLFNWRWWLGMPPKSMKRGPPHGITVTALIPAFNEEQSIATTILSIKRQTVPVDEIIVVDDCSTDNTGEIAKDMGVRVICTPQNRGTKAQAQSYGLQFIHTDLFVTVDADTILARDAMEKVLPAFNEENVSAACGYIIPQKVSSIWERGRFIEYILALMILKPAQDNIGVVLVSCGCFSVFCTKDVKDFGGFVPRSMAEDMDLTWTLLENKRTVRYVSKARSFPIDPPTRKVYFHQLDRWYRGFLQNIYFHRRSIWKNKKLGLLVHWYVFEVTVITALWPVGVFWVTESVVLTVVFLLVLEATIVTLLSTIKGVFMGQPLKTISSVPAYLLIRPFNLFLFWRAIWREWIRKEKLSEWHKGH